MDICFVYLFVLVNINNTEEEIDSVSGDNSGEDIANESNTRRRKQIEMKYKGNAMNKQEKEK